MKKTPARSNIGNDNRDDTLAQHGFKKTKQRLDILAAFSLTHTPLSAEDIFQSRKKLGLDLATVYRTIVSFEKAGILRKVDIRKKSQFYELAHDHHHHMTCTDCGFIEDFDACNIEPATEKALRKSSFKRIDSHSIELFGICKSCSKS
jgi:Fe2+ or Zn2+ uptake regulation protein